MNLDRKHRYLILSVIMSGLMLWFLSADSFTRNTVVVVTFLVVLVGTAVSHYPNISLKNMGSSVIIPFHLVSGIFLTFIYFPNLSMPIKLLTIAFFGLFFYIVCLVNNVFLVVEDKNEIIPLYRAALAWNQILIIVVTVPFFAGIFKLPINPVFQNSIIFLSSTILSGYLLWILDLDKDLKRVKVGERAILSLLVGFLAFVYGFCVSFMPTEAFLRALFVASFLMFGLSYLHSYLKNVINRNLVLEYTFISLVFLILLIVFSP